MKTAIVAVCYFLLTIGVLLPSAEAVPMTADELETLFKTFGKKYIEFRKMPNEPVEDKNNAFTELWKIVQDNNWDTDASIRFQLCSLDPPAFNTSDKAPLFIQWNVIFRVSDSVDKLKGIEPLSLFRDPCNTKPSAQLTKSLELIQTFIKQRLAGLFKVDERKVVYHYELFNGHDLGQPSDPDARKEYALTLSGIATK